MTHPHYPYPVQIRDDEAELFLVVEGVVCPYPVRFPVGTTFLVDDVERPDPSVGLFGSASYTLVRDGLAYIYDGDDFFDDVDVDDGGHPIWYPGKFEFVPVYCPGTEIPLDDEAGPDQGCYVCGNNRINFRSEGKLTFLVTHEADPVIVTRYLQRKAVS